MEGARLVEEGGRRGEEEEEEERRVEAIAPAEGWRKIVGMTRGCVEEDGSRKGRLVLEESSRRADLEEGADCSAARARRRALVLKTLGIRARGKRGAAAGWRLGAGAAAGRVGDG